jgi:hypothetical protein
MSYLGRGLEQVDNISKLDNITFNGGTTYALTKDSAAFTPISSNAILISIDGVIQQGNFSVSGTNIVFNFSPTGSNTCDFILHYGTGVAFTPADSSVTKDKANFISTSSAAGLQIKGDGTTDGTLQLNCSQNSHGIKLKSPAHSTSSSYTLTFPGTDPAANKMLQTDGSGNLSFVDAPSGAMTLIASAEGTNSVGDVSINDCFSATYANYLITFAINNDRSGNYNNFRFQKDDDTTFNSDYNYCLWGYDENGNLRTSFSNSGSACPLNSLETPDDDSWVFGSCTGYMYVYHPYTLTTGGLRRLRAIGQVFNINTSGEVSGQSLQMQLKQNSSNVAGIRFRPSANYITERRVRVYGLKDS